MAYPSLTTDEAVVSRYYYKAIAALDDYREVLNSPEQRQRVTDVIAVLADHAPFKGA